MVDSSFISLSGKLSICTEIKKWKIRMEECECFGESGSQHEKDENQRNCLGMRPSKCFSLQAVT